MKFNEVLRQVFQDENGAMSYGRVASGYLVVSALLAFVAGLQLPQYAEYCKYAMSSFLTTAGSMYGLGKLQQGASKFATKLPDSPPAAPPSEAANN